MSDDYLTLGTPLAYKVSGLKLLDVVINPTEYTWYIAVKDALTNTDANAIVDTDNIASPGRFSLDATTAEVSCLTAAESQALAGNITPHSDGDLYIDDQLVIGQIFFTISAKKGNVGPYVVEHKRLYVTNSTNLTI